MNTINLDFSKCKYIGDVHYEIKNKFGFPDYYGEKLDALWDCLDYYTTEKLTVEILGFMNIEKLFYDYASRIKVILERVSFNSSNINFKFLS